MSTSGMAPSEIPTGVSLPAPEAAGELGSVALSYIQELREKAQVWHSAGAGGVAVVDYYTGNFDKLIRFLFEAAACSWRARYVQGGEELAVLAQGGYGRAELNPYSVIDPLFLLPHKVTPFAGASTGSILFSLWVPRSRVGHSG